MTKSPQQVFDFNSLSVTQHALAVEPILRTSKGDSKHRLWSPLSQFATEYWLPIDTPHFSPSVLRVFFRSVLNDVIICIRIASRYVILHYVIRRVSITSYCIIACIAPASPFVVLRHQRCHLSNRVLPLRLKAFDRQHLCRPINQPIASLSRATRFVFAGINRLSLRFLNYQQKFASLRALDYKFSH